MTRASSITLELLLATLASQRGPQKALHRVARGDVPPPTSTRSRVKTQRSAQLIAPRGQARLPDTVEIELLPGPLSPAEKLVVGAKGATPSVEIRCFGHFEVACHGVPVRQWRRSKAKTLLKYLAAHRRAVSRDELLDLLWPDSDPALAVNSLRVVLHSLRQVLAPMNGDGPSAGSSLVESGEGRYGLNRESGIWVDADEFTFRFEDGLRLERQGRMDLAKRHFEQAEAVYRDDYLLEDVYEDWTLLRREEFKDRYLMILTKLADDCLVRGDAEGSIVRCHKILQKDPCSEDAYRRLMRCHAMLGQHSQAMNWYNLCVRTLRHELDTDPSAPTRHLRQQIAVGEVV